MTRPTRHLRRVRRPLLLGLVAAALSLAAAPPAAHAQRFWADKEQSKSAESLKSAFKEVVYGANQSTVLIRCAGKNVAFGTVVSADGHVLTKASELMGDAAIVFRDASQRPAKVVGIAEDYDLALLKVDLPKGAGGGLTPVRWADAKAAVVGQWVATTGMLDAPSAVGVLSVGPRKIPARNGLLGVLLADADGAGAKVLQVVAGSPAERAGIKVDDLIAKVNNKPIDSRDALVNTIRSFMPGQEVTLGVKRGPKELEMRAKLVGGVGPGARAEMMNQMGGPLSLRNANFPSVIQHDTVLLPTQCGGPLVGLDGRAVGVNIARAGRVESFAVPADVVVALLPDLKSGKLAPKSQEKPTTKPAEKKNEE